MYREIPPQSEPPYVRRTHGRVALTAPDYPKKTWASE
jgi:hypothetical protein